MTSVAVIETDAFCERCGFNLRTQAVWRDERLGILVCRCPECGTHAAAGRSTTSSSAWLRRLAFFGLTLWVACQLAIALASVLGVLIVQLAANGTLTEFGNVTADGRTVIARGSPSGVQFSMGEDQPFDVDPATVYQGRRVKPWLLGHRSERDAYYDRGLPTETAIAAACIGLVVLLVATFFGAASWHWRRGAVYAWLVLPIVGTLIAGAMIASEHQLRSVGGIPTKFAAPRQELWLAAAVGFLITLVMAIGLFAARPLARRLVSLFVPPASRQLFAFLWHCDGKTMPPAKAHLPA